MKKYILPGLLLSVCLLSCDEKKQVKPNNIIGIYDFSQSRDTSVHKFYKTITLNNLLPLLGMKDRFIAIPVDRGSETASQEIFYKDFAKYNYINKYAGLQTKKTSDNWHKDSLRATKAQFTEAFNQAFLDRKGLSNETDIVGVFDVARKYFRSEHRNLMIVFCDMQQSTKAMNFEKEFTDAFAYSLLRTLHKVDLHGWDVIILTGRQESMENVKFNKIKKFWTQYLTSCGAAVIDYSSGAVSKIDEWFNSSTTNE